MNEPLILTFDIGTQSIRALLAKKDGTFLDMEQYTYEEPYFSPMEFWAEQKPDFYFEALSRVSGAVLGRHRDILNDIKGVTLTTIRDTVFCLDKDCKPLRNAILWLDDRGAKFDPAKVGIFKSALLRLVGMYDTIEMQTEKSACNWIMQNEPEIWQQTAHYVYLSTYLNYLLTGKLTDSVGSLIGHMPIDYKTGKWMGKNGLTRCVYDVPNDKLCDSVQPGETIGYITEEASAKTGIPKGLELIATGSDKGCETLGLSVRKPGKAAVSFGTSATIQIATEKYLEPSTFIPPYPAVIKGVYNPELQIYRGYWMLSWFIKEFAQEEARAAKELGLPTERLLDDHLKDVPIGSNGLFIQPYWSQGVATPNARGSMIGFTDKQTKYHIYRAIIEGINFEIMGGLKNLARKSGVPITEVFVGGGGSRSDAILKISADMFGIPVKRIQTHEACALGASIIGFVHAGVYKDYDEASSRMIREGDIFLPDTDNHRRYEELYANIYSGMFKTLSPIFKKEKILFKDKK